VLGVHHRLYTGRLEHEKNKGSLSTISHTKGPGRARFVRGRHRRLAGARAGAVQGGGVVAAAAACAEAHVPQQPLRAPTPGGAAGLPGCAGAHLTCQAHASLGACREQDAQQSSAGWGARRVAHLHFQVAGALGVAGQGRRLAPGGAAGPPHRASAHLTHRAHAGGCRGVDGPCKQCRGTSASICAEGHVPYHMRCAARLCKTWKQDAPRSSAGGGVGRRWAVLQDEGFLCTMGSEMDRMSEAGTRMQTREWTFGARLPVWRRENVGHTLRGILPGGRRLWSRDVPPLGCGLECRSEHS